jgi:hypothetical protein
MNYYSGKGLIVVYIMSVNKLDKLNFTVGSIISSGKCIQKLKIVYNIKTVTTIHTPDRHIIFIKITH